jgi:hypothetical protein
MVVTGLFLHTILLVQPDDIGNRAIVVQEI